MKFRLVLVIAFCVGSLTAHAQDNAVSKGNSAPSNLRLTANVKVPLSGTLVGKARCDDDINLYIRFMDAEMSKKYHGITQSPIEKIKPDGGLAATFRVTDASPDSIGKSFFVTGNGRVYQAAWTPDGAVYVVEYSSDGSFKSRTKLDAEFFTPYQIALFRSGEFLLSGTKGPNDRTPFTAVFSADGGLIKKIYETEDENSRQKAESGDRDFLSDSTNAGNTSVWYGDAVTGSDGNVYLLRSTSPALIYVISPKGEVVHKLRVDSGNSALVARTIRSGPGRLAISFLERYSTKGMVKVVDFQGNPIVDYSSDDERTYPGLPGCYHSGAFTFLMGDAEHNVYLHKAEPK